MFIYLVCKPSKELNKKIISIYLDIKLSTFSKLQQRTKITK